MINYFRENTQIYFLMIFWLVVGIFAGPLSYVLVPVTMLLMFKKRMYEELLIGYLFILILSDSLEDGLLFAKSVKNIYISMLSLFFFMDMNNFQPLNKLFKIFLPFFLFSVFTMLFSVTDPFFFTSVQKTLSFFLNFLVIPNIVIRLLREKGPTFLRDLMIFLLVTLVVGIALKFFAHDIVHIESGRYRGVMGNPNGLGIYCVLTFILFYVITDLYPDLFSLTDKVIYYVFVLGSILMTDSRNAILGVLIFFIFQRFFSLSPYLGFIIFICFMFVAEFISNNLSSVIVYLGLGDFFRIDTLEEGSGRYVAWEFAWRQIQQNFFIGKGFAYNEFYMRQHYDVLGKLGHQGGIHNSFLTFWMDQGLIGLLIYLRSFILIFIKSAKQSRFAFPIMFTIMFTAMFESWLVGSLSAFALLAMIIYTIITAEETTPERIEEYANSHKQNEEILGNKVLN